MSERVCKDCRRLMDDDDAVFCGACGSTSLSSDWSGRVVIVDPDGSEIAAEMDVPEPGEYALQVR